MIEKKSVLPAVWLAVLMDVTATWIFWLFWINACVYIYKGICLPYSGSDFGMELTYYFVWGLIMVLRNSVGQHALSRCEVMGLIFYVVLSLFGLICCSFYFIYYQTYILRIEVIFNAFCIGVNGLEMILAIICLIIFARKQAI